MHSLFCGWLDDGAASYDRNAALAAMVGRSRRELRPTDLRCIDGAVGLWARCAPGDSLDDGRFTVAIWGNPDWRDLARDHAATRAATLLEAYRRDGTELLQRLRGPCAFVIVDRRAQEAFIAIDRLGIHSLTFAELPGRGLLFGTSADAPRAHPAGGADLDARALHHYLYFHAVPSPLSVFTGQRKLLPGQYLHWRHGRCDVQTYWLPEFSESLDRPRAALEMETRDVLRKSVARCLGSSATGCFLSGGIDSSTVTGLAAELSAAPVRTYTIGFDTAAYNEVEYARVTARHFGANAREYFVTRDDVVEGVQRIAGHYDEPFGNSSALPTYCCARMARADGIETLLAGDGGDELFGGNVRYVKQLVFDSYFRLPAKLRREVLEPLFVGDTLLSRLAGTRKVSRYIEQALMPMPDRLESFNFLATHQPERILDDAVLESTQLDSPLELNRRVYSAVNDASMLNRMLYLDWKQTLADNDLRKVQGMCELAGVEVRFPFLDDAVVELSTRIPSAWKIRRYRLRHFFKRAMRDFLPPAVLRKSKHGFGLPFGIWMQEYAPLRTLAYDSLASLKRRRIVRTAYLDELVRLHGSEHAKYYGEFIWVLMMLELWLQQHASRSAAATPTVSWQPEAIARP